MINPLDEFLQALTSAGYKLAPGKSLESDDKWHRLLYDNEKSSSGRYRVKMVGSDFAIGSFGSDKDPGGFHKWHSKSMATVPLSKEERAALKKQQDDYRTSREVELESKQKRLAERLVKAIRNLKPGLKHPYLAKKKIADHGVLLRQKRNEIVIPMLGADGLVWNVQRIAANGWKGFFKGARVNGTCYPIGEFRDVTDASLLICEGFATGASIHEVTGLPVRVAFNTGNLKHVAQMLRQKYPDARIAFCADNDRWTFRPGKKPADEKVDKIATTDPRWAEWNQAGLLWNPGVEKAQQAAAAIGGAVVIWPEFVDISTRPTDFNDLRLLEGDESVKNRIDTALVWRVVAPPEVPEEWAAMAESGSDLGQDHVQPPHSSPASPWPFKILGHNEGLYYFFPRHNGQIFSSTASGLSNMANLFRLANLDFWNDHFNVGGKLKSRTVAELAANALIQEAHDIGIFSPTNVRGAGAWLDNGKPVIHCGDSLLVEGEKIAPHRFPSRYVYPLRDIEYPVGAEPLGARQAVKLRDICSKLSWETKLSGDLLAGWIVIAPICGALEWRPHIWVEGESESGKTTVIDRIIRPLLDGMSQRFDGGTTEASIRQVMGSDALPVIYDEAEPENIKDRIIMDGLLLLARRSSSGGRIAKGGSGGKAEIFNVRSCFCFAGINPAIKQRADESRISRLIIKKATFDGADTFYKDLKKQIRETLTQDFAHRLLARTIENLPVLIANSMMFTDAAADVLTSRRAADQIGPMLAGLFLLTSEKRIDYDQAVAFIKKHDWTMHTAIAENSDPERLITYISTYPVRFRNNDHPIGELIMKAHENIYTPELETDYLYGRFLRSMGIWVRHDGVLFANKSPPLERILSNTAWISWARPMKDIPNSVQIEPLKFATGLNSRSVKVPLQAFGIEEIV